MLTYCVVFSLQESTQELQPAQISWINQYFPVNYILRTFDCICDAGLHQGSDALVKSGFLREGFCEDLHM